MSRDDFEHRLRDALRTDVQPASPGFTRRVMAGLEKRPRRHLVASRPAMVAAALTLAVVAGLAAWRGVDTASAPEAGGIAQQELLDEYRRLEAELDEVRRLADDADPVLYLGGTESFDLLYDLESYQPSPSGDVRPAAMRDRG
ncbi:MAG: hypothetical protein R3244_06260 [Thermoanaerobaculia bacterium]|nr:hypothetical protein [Thermoanaerobaculia bacterium]